MTKLTTSGNQPKAKMLVEVLTTEDKLKIMEKKRKEKESEKNKDKSKNTK